MSSLSSATEQVRSALRTSVDPRPQRTKEAIVDAVRVLGDRGEPVTVPGIVKVAGVSRSSFYAHFENLDALALFVFERGFDRLDGQRGTVTDGPRQPARYWVELVVDHYVEHQALYSAVLTLPSVSHEVHSQAVRRVAAAMLEWAPPLPGAEPGPAALAYAANGFVGILDAWLLGEFAATRRDLAQQVIAALPPWLVGGADDAPACDAQERLRS